MARTFTSTTGSCSSTPGSSIAASLVAFATPCAAPNTIPAEKYLHKTGRRVRAALRHRTTFETNPPAMPSQAAARRRTLARQPTRQWRRCSPRRHQRESWLWIASRTGVRGAQAAALSCKGLRYTYSAGYRVQGGLEGTPGDQSALGNLAECGLVAHWVLPGTLLMELVASLAACSKLRRQDIGLLQIRGRSSKLR